MLSALRIVIPYMLRRRWRYTAGLAALLARALLAVGIPFALGMGVDALAAGEPVRDYAAALVGLAVAKAILQYLSQQLLVGAARDVEEDLREDLFARLTQLPQRFYAERPVGELLSLAVNDIVAVRMLLGPGLLQFVEALFVGTLALGLMSAVDWRLTLLIFLPIPFISLTVNYYGKRTQESFTALQQRLAALSAFLEERFSGLRTLRAYTRAEAERERFRQVNEGYFDAALALIRVWRRFYPQLELLTGLTWAATLGYGGWRILEGAMTVGDLTLFLASLALLTWPVIGLGWALNLVERGAASLERIHQIFRTPLQIVDGPHTDYSIDGVRGDLELEEAAVYFPGTEEPILDHISLHAASGVMIAIVGPVGAGKTTLLNLVARRIEPARGRILLDGAELRSVPLAVLRASVGFAVQEPFLFDGTVRENMLLGRPDAEAWEVDEAARIAQLTGEIADLPEGLDTPVGEQGAALSGGQRQRVALARALLREPRLLLLDDSLSSVDLETEVAILERLRLYLRNRTTLYVTHRAAAAQLADEILVLERGQVVERGSHRDLLAAQGRYYDIYQRQMLEEELIHDE
ncbi:MAG: ATP-binding cassette domain-containing protein [Acidobacteria bacterium]|nr:ATP-binding cassette domain-containing protein [Acidobacteriota bacterium]